jgi:NAD(P)-dependent dehydrogenase (short-subunit alcohol dehydrogenase family)
VIYVRGFDSAIAQALCEFHPIKPVPRGVPMPGDGDRYLFCVGLIRQKRIEDQSEAEVTETFEVNAYQVIRDCEQLIDENPTARICVIGSESAFKGSFDMAYAEAKRDLHHYVETKRLKYPGQQLVCVAPTCVVNTKMNKQRNADGVASLEARRLKHPKQRWLRPVEVARMIHFLLCVDEGYTTNVVLRMNGGEHCV